MEEQSIKAMRDGLNVKNRAIFDAMDRDLQLGIYAEAFKDGILYFTAGGRTTQDIKEATHD